MSSFFLWYLTLVLLGWLTFPLVYRLFPALPDRGFTVARAAGLLLWGYLFWLLASLGIAQNDIGGILLALALIVALSVWIASQRNAEIIEFLRSHLGLIFTTEILFFVAFGFLAIVRAANPELTSTEKPMELAFISAIMRSPSFPPQDPWLSGYAISYYYFGYVMTAMLAKLTSVPSSMAHNLMTALIFGLGAIGAYGILYNLLTIINRKSAAISALFAPLFLLLISNFEGLLEVLHQRGLFWVKDAATGLYTSSFWKWLDMQELSKPPTLPFGWVPSRYLWWWRASRVIQDYDMTGSFREVIDEFPFFSFLLGDLHPHVLAIPFGLLAIAVALNLFLGGWKGHMDIFGAGLYIKPEGFLFAALVLGGLAFLNTWDILIAAALIVSAYVLWCANEDGWRWERLEDMLILGLPLGIVSIVLYLPFYFGFSSQAGGVLPNLMFPTRGAQLWVMWGTLFIPIFAYLIYLWRSGVQKLAPITTGSRQSESKWIPNWKLGVLLGVGFALFLWILSWAIGWVGSFFEQDFVTAFLASQGMTIGQFFIATTWRRLDYIGSLITLLALLIPALSFLFGRKAESAETELESAKHGSPVQFVILLITLGTVLILVPDFVYLRDQFGYRINTVFKFYYQAWILLSIAAAFAVTVLLQKLRGMSDILFRVVIAFVIFAGLLYPSFGLLTKTNNFHPVNGFSLDDFDRIKRDNPDEAAAIQFLRVAPNGVLAEAVGDSYSQYARISTYTGLQTVLGWPGHEAQWRGSAAPQGTRRADITTLYTTARWEDAQAIIAKYNIRYIYIGDLERISMRVNEGKFQAHLKPVFQQGNVTIYEAP